MKSLIKGYQREKKVAIHWSIKCRILDISQSCRPTRSVTGTALHYLTVLITLAVNTHCIIKSIKRNSTEGKHDNYGEYS
jgi:hypothetical protein